jgi:hypothetical protein
MMKCDKDDINTCMMKCDKDIGTCMLAWDDDIDTCMLAWNTDIDMYVGMGWWHRLMYVGIR